MNNLVSIGLIYSASNNNAAFAVVEKSDNELDVMAINEFACYDSHDNIENILGSIFQNYLNSLIVISFKKIDSIQFESASNGDVKQQIQRNAPYRLLKKLNGIYTYADMLNSNEIQALKLAIDNIDNLN